MTKDEAIRETAYSEDELIDIALICAMNKFREHWNECLAENDMAGAEHYMALTMAYQTMHEAREQK